MRTAGVEPNGQISFEATWPEATWHNSFAGLELLRSSDGNRSFESSSPVAALTETNGRAPDGGDGKIKAVKICPVWRYCVLPSPPPRDPFGGDGRCLADSRSRSLADI